MLTEPKPIYHVTPITEASRFAGAYRRNIRSATRALWNEALSLDQFVESMFLTIRQGLTQAWAEGAAACGVFITDLTGAERVALERAISSENSHVFGFALDIEDNNRANGGLLRPLMSRAEMWVNRFGDVVGRAQVMACEDEKLEWEIDPTIDNCQSCLRLKGKVKRASFWQASGVIPRNPPNQNLECSGWRCGCRLKTTTKPVSRGPLPRLP